MKSTNGYRVLHAWPGVVGGLPPAKYLLPDNPNFAGVVDAGEAEFSPIVSLALPVLSGLLVLQPPPELAQLTAHWAEAPALTSQLGPCQSSVQ